MLARHLPAMGHPGDPGQVTFHPERLEQPLHWRKPRRIFVCSMSDLFHPDVPREWQHRVHAIMAACPRHVFLTLTKRPTVLRDRMHDGWDLANVWRGVTVCNQAEADAQVPALLQTPAALRFLSLEPLLGPVDLDGLWGYPGSATCDLLGRWSIRLLIVGGETGPGARPMHPAWVRSLREQCAAAGVPFFLKSWGEWLPRSQGAGCRGRRWGTLCADGAWWAETTPWNGHDDDGEGEAVMVRVGRKLAGARLDGREWKELPT